MLKSLNFIIGAYLELEILDLVLSLYYTFHFFPAD